MSMQRIRDYYRVPAKRGMVIKFQGIEMAITSASPASMHLNVRSTKTGQLFTIHPTWEVEYPTHD